MSETQDERLLRVLRAMRDKADEAANRVDDTGEYFALRRIAEVVTRGIEAAEDERCGFRGVSRSGCEELLGHDGRCKP